MLYSNNFKVDEDASAFYQWWQAFDKKCQQQGYTTAEQQASYLLEFSDAIAGGKLVLLEFDDIPPLYQGLFKSVSGELITHSSNREEALCQALGCTDEEEEI